MFLPPLVPSAASPKPPPGVVLRFKYRPGRIRRYQSVLTTDMPVNLDGSPKTIRLVLTSVCRDQVLKVKPNGTADIGTFVEEASVTANSKPVSATTNKGIRFNWTLNNLGEPTLPLSFSSGMKLVGDPQSLILLPSLPPVPVEAGFTWATSTGMRSRVQRIDGGVAEIDSYIEIDLARPFKIEAPDLPQNRTTPSDTNPRLRGKLDLHLAWTFDIAAGNIKTLTGTGALRFIGLPTALNRTGTYDGRLTFLVTPLQGANESGRNSAALMRSPNLPGTTVKSNSLTARSQQGGR